MRSAGHSQNYGDDGEVILATRLLGIFHDLMALLFNRLHFLW